MNRFLAIALALVAAVAHAQPVQEEAVLASSIRRALERDSAVRGDSCLGWTPCRERIAAFADSFQQAASEHGVSPWVLAAVAWQESGFNPTPHRSPAWNGELSIMQLKPAYYRDVPFVAENDAYRAQCLTRADACQGPAVSAAARVLARNLRSCRGSVAMALNRYNIGRGCVAEHHYARRILNRARWLRRPRSQ